MEKLDCSTQGYVEDIPVTLLFLLISSKVFN